MASLGLSLSTKKAIKKHYERHGCNKTHTARWYGISQRTVGRIIDELSKAEATKQTTAKAVEQQAVALVEKVVSDPHTYLAVASKSLITMVRINSETGETITETCTPSHPNYEKVEELYALGRNEEAFFLMSKKVQIEKLSHGNIVAYPSEGRLVYDDGNFFFDFPVDLFERINQDIMTGTPLNAMPYMRFAERLAKNPDADAVRGLYSFLKASDITINEDGMVECYKRIRHDFKDVYTGTIDNSVGQTPTMPRSLVVKDPNQTCSAGLHVCSKAYLRHYGGEVVVKVLVDPADFVSIPLEYFKLGSGKEVTAKARVCRYHVVSVVEDM